MGILSNEINLCVSNVCMAFEPSAIGTRVVDRCRFDLVVELMITDHDASKDRIPGQHFIVLQPRFWSLVSCGVGPRTKNPADYLVREHRGVVSLFLKRERAAQAESLAVIVYTREAYLADPDVEKDTAEAHRIRTSADTHVLVAVLASAGPKAPLGYERFVKNLAGGNKEALVWSADEIRAKASELPVYWDQWCVVADAPLNQPEP